MKNRGYTLVCKSCGKRCQFTQDGYMGSNDVMSILKWHNDNCTGMTVNERIAQSHIDAANSEVSE